MYQTEVVSQKLVLIQQSLMLFQEGEAEEEYPAEDEEAADHGCRKTNTEECDEDGLEDLPSSICRRGAVGRWRGPISRKASQTSVYLQEWDIPYEQLQLGELIGKVKIVKYNII